jgi:hypothetical protein
MMGGEGCQKVYRYLPLPTLIKAFSGSSPLPPSFKQLTQLTDNGIRILFYRDQP